MGRKKKTVKESAVKTFTQNKTCSVTKKMQTRSVQDMDDSTYMYMLIIGQLMYDRRHLIAEKLADDLSITAMALASSDALIRIIRKSREAQQKVSPSIGQAINSKELTLITNLEAVKKEDKASSSFEEEAEATDTEATAHADVDDNDDDDIFNDETFPTIEDEETKCIPRNKELKKNIFPTNLSDASNIPRETADGKIIMVYVPQEKFPCPRPNCKQTFLTKENLDYHLVCSRIHNPQFVKDWGCRYCGKEFSGMSHVKHHEKMKHEEHDKEVCYECGKQFDSLEKMKRHIDVHHLLKKYKCKDESCPMEFSSESGAKYHYKRVHLKDQIPCTMEGCPRKFDRNCDLRRHVEKAHRDGRCVSVRGPRKQTQQPQLQPSQHLEHQQQPVQQPPVQQQPVQQPPVQQQPVQQHIEQQGQQQILHVVEQATDPQQALLPTQYQQQETTYTTMQTITQQMAIPATVIPSTTLDPQQQQLNQEQLQAIQSLQFLQQQQQQPQQQPQPPSQFPPVPTSSYHGGYMY